MNSYSISCDLISEILSRLPAKSVARFRCVSKLWASIIGTPYFTDQLFLTMSSTKPHLLFAILEEEDGVWSFFSLPQLQNPYEKSSSTLVVAAEFHVKFSPGDLRIHLDINPRYFQCAYTSGLIYFNGSHYDDRPLVCNPNTGRYAILPYLHNSYIRTRSFFGFEPNDKQYKLLFMSNPFGISDSHHILTLGRNIYWREIKCSLGHEIISEGVCINGVLYYLGYTLPWYVNKALDDETSDYVIVCFDLRSEKFTYIYVERYCQLVNYKGKLAMIFWEYDDVDFYSDNDHPIYSEDSNIIKLHVWVQEDVEQQEWSKYSYSLNDNKLLGLRRLFIAFSIVGVTPWGEIVFSIRECTSEELFYVFFFNPEKNTLLRVEIQGVGETL